MSFRAIIAKSWLRYAVQGGSGAIPAQPVVALPSDEACDAFGRFRISQPVTVFASKQLVDNDPLQFDDQQVSGTATSTWSATTASSVLSVTGNVAGRRVRQSFRRLAYQPGKSQLVMLTSTLLHTGGGVVGITRRVGLFDDNNGLFFEHSGGVAKIARRLGGVDFSADQSTWNIDKLDGTGFSGITIDFTKSQIFVIDFEWLGVGRVRYGFNIDGITIYCHEMLHANATAGVYIASPSLPVRYELTSVGTGAASAAKLEAICAAVISEGGQDSANLFFACDSGATPVSSGNNTNHYGLLAIRLRSGFLAAVIRDLVVGVMSPTVTVSYRVALTLNPTIASTAPTYSAVNAASAVEFAPLVAANLISGGTLLRSYHVASNRTSDPPIALPRELTLGSSIAGTADVLTLSFQPTPGSVIDAYGSLSWREEH